LVVVNQRGHRFFDEMSPYSTTETAIRAQDGPVYAIFDDAAKHAASAVQCRCGEEATIPGGHRPRRIQWIEPLIDEMVEKGVVHVAESIETLAKQIDVPAPNLTGTVERYNDDIAEDRDSFLQQAD